MPTFRVCTLPVAVIVGLILFLLRTGVAGGQENDLPERVKCADIKRHEIEAHLSTKTPYRAVANLNDAPKKYPALGCRPTRIWSVIRHGSRNPGKKLIQRAQSDLVRLKDRILEMDNKTRLCAAELENLRWWQFNVSIGEEKFLVAEGEDELIELAERMQNRFPELLSDTYDPHFYHFKHTLTQRTLKSAESFTTGLFGRHRIREIVYPEALHKDPVLRLVALDESKEKMLAILLRIRRLRRRATPTPIYAFSVPGAAALGVITFYTT